MKIVIIGVLLVFWTSAATAQSTETISLGLVNLQLGSPREAVQETISQYYVLKATTSGSGPVDSFLVWDGKTPVGNVAFRGGRLKSVFKFWGPPDQQAGVPLAQKLYAAVSSLIRDGHRSCLLDTASSDEPQSEQRVVFIRCGRRSLEVSVLRSDKHGEFADVVEKLE